MDASLLPNKIDSVVIGDRLFNLSIIVEGLDEVPIENKMDIDNDKNGAEGAVVRKKTRNQIMGNLSSKKQDNNDAVGSKPPQKCATTKW